MRKTFTALRMLLIVASIGFVGLCSATAFTFLDSWVNSRVSNTVSLDGKRDAAQTATSYATHSAINKLTASTMPLLPVTDTFFIGLPGGGGIQTCLDLGGANRSIQNIQHCGTGTTQLSVSLLNETCINVTALSQTVTDTFCAKNCSTTGDCRDMVLVFNSVSRFPRCGAISSRNLITINTPNCAALGCYCLADSVDINDLRDNYKITDNGINYSGGYRGCNFDTIYSYTYFTVPNMGRRGPYRLDSWTINNTTRKIASFNTMQQLVDSMNVWDPIGNWQLDSTVFAISGGSTRNTYGQIKITRIANRAIGLLELNLGIVSNGIQMCFSTGGHQVIFKNNVTGCADTITVRVVCTDTMTNLKPRAVDDIATTTKNTSVTIPALTNDVFNGTLTGPLSIVRTPRRGTASVVNNQIVYNPETDFCGGKDTLSYQICNANGCDTADVVITVNCNNGSNLVAIDDRISTRKNTRIRFTPLSNDTIVGGLLGISIVTTPRHGNIGFVGTDSLDYVPNNDYCGLDTMEYRVCNSLFVCDTATVFITVNCDTNQTLKPIAVDDVASTRKNTPTTISVLTNDQTNGTLTGPVMVLSLPQHGSTTTQNNQVIYTPDTAYCGNDAFTYQICNANGCDTATVTVSVTCDTIALLKPDAIADVATTKKNQSVTISVLSNDQTNGTLTAPVRVIKNPSRGTASVTNNQIIYNPQQDFCGGNDTLSYEICNVTGCDTAQVVVSVTCDTVQPTRLVAVDDRITTRKNIKIRFTPLSNDTLVSNLLALGVVTAPRHGSIAFIGTDSLDYIPGIDYCGLDTMEYRLCNTNFVCDTATIFITVTCDTTPTLKPDAITDVVTTKKNQATTISVLNNDVLNGTLTGPVRVITNPRLGTAAVTINQIIYTPNRDTCGFNDTLSYEICNANGCDTAQVIVTVSCDTTPILKPDAVTDVVTTKKNQATTISVLNNDVLNGTLTGPVRVITNPRLGTAAVTNNQIIYTPNRDTCGFNDTLSYEICNANGCDTAQIIVTVSCDTTSLLKPDAVTDVTTTKKNQAATISVLNNDVLNGTLTGPVRVITNPRLGTASVTNNQIIYTPNRDTCGFNDTLSYEICNANGCDTAQVIVSVKCDTVTPTRLVAVDDRITTAQNRAVRFTPVTNDTLIGTLLTVGIVKAPRHGSISYVGLDTLNYLPDIDFCGLDTMEYRLCNNDFICDTATVFITVTCNIKPDAIADTNTTKKNQTTTISVLNNDILNGTLTDPVRIINNPRLGTATVTNNQIIYTPNRDTCGFKDTLSYAICNDFGCDTAQVVVTVNCDTTPTLKPDAVTDVRTTNKNQAVTVNVLGNDILNGTLTGPVRIINNPRLGTASVTNNQIIYTPNRDTCGFNDTLSYEICNINGCDTAQVIVTVSCDTTPLLRPDAITDTTTTKKNQTVTVNVMSNDVLNGRIGSPIRIITNPRLGTAVVRNNLIDYTPNRDTCGFTDSLTYELCNTFGCDTAAVIVTVICDSLTKLLPIAINDLDSVKIDGSVIISVLTNDTLNGSLVGPLSIVTQPTFGTATVNRDGTVTYKPFAGYCGGNDVFRYQICNSNGCDTATVTVRVLCDTTIKKAPVAVPDVVTTRKNTPISITILANDTLNGTLDSIKIIRSPLFGTAILGSNNIISYTPDSCGFTDSLIYRICNRNGCDTALVTIKVTCDTIFPKPVAINDSAQTTRNRSIVINVVRNDSLFGARLDTISIFKRPTRGSVLVESGQIRYLPQTDSCGYRDTFSYVICTRGGCDTADVVVTVSCNENLAPIAERDTARTKAGQAITISVTLNDSLRGADTFRITRRPSNGTAAFDTLNRIRYTPASTFCGKDTLIYEICNRNGCDTALVTITVDCVPPVALDDSAKTRYNILVGIPITLNDTLNGTDSIAVITQPTRGSVSILVDKTASYTPARDFCGQDSFRYVICNRVGCDTAVVRIEISCGDSVIVFNGFSPNNDGKNDGFYIRGIENYPENEVVVFNRWGNEVYRKKGYRNDTAWQGTWNDFAVPDGTYFYCIYLNDSKGTKYIGYVQIMK